MRAVVVHGPEDLRVEEIPDLQHREGRVLIEVRAAGLVYSDTLVVRGRYQLALDYPFTPGFEVAGVVRAAPADSGFAPGDEVMAFTNKGGGMAELAEAGSEWVLSRPPELDWPQAAGFFANAHTAYYALVERGHLKAGQTVLIHGAAGGVGVACTQMADALGARVIALVSTDERAAMARDAGAHEVIVAGEDWPDEVRALAPDGLVDVVVDTVGGDRTEPSLKLLRRRGRLLVLGFVAGKVPKLPLQRVLNQDADVVGVAWTTAAIDDPSLTQSMHAALLPLVAEGRMHPVVSRVYELDDAAQAFDAIAERTALGKLALRVS